MSNGKECSVCDRNFCICGDVISYIEASDCCKKIHAGYQETIKEHQRLQAERDERLREAREQLENLRKYVFIGKGFIPAIELDNANKIIDSLLSESFGLEKGDV